MLKQDSSCSNRQHHGSGLPKQGKSHEIGLIVCNSMEDPDLVLQETGYCQSLTHSRLAECRQTSYPDRVVSRYRCLSVDMQQVAPTSNRPSMKFNNKLAPIVSPVSRSPGLNSPFTQPPVGGSGSIWLLSTSSHFWPSGGEDAELSNMIPPG